ncbi:hypothetical protein H0H93_013178 [Arthromyces matolae]|nr:hypothetical protein H0H93_013178 [Arthromyces matolae]
MIFITRAILSTCILFLYLASASPINIPDTNSVVVARDGTGTNDVSTSTSTTRHRSPSTGARTIDTHVPSADPSDIQKIKATLSDLFRMSLPGAAGFRGLQRQVVKTLKGLVSELEQVQGISPEDFARIYVSLWRIKLRLGTWGPIQSRKAALLQLQRWESIESFARRVTEFWKDADPKQDGLMDAFLKTLEDIERNVRPVQGEILSEANKHLITQLLLCGLRMKVVDLIHMNPKIYMRLGEVVSALSALKNKQTVTPLWSTSDEIPLDATSLEKIPLVTESLDDKLKQLYSLMRHI